MFVFVWTNSELIEDDFKFVVDLLWQLLETHYFTRPFKCFVYFVIKDESENHFVIFVTLFKLETLTSWICRNNIVIYHAETRQSVQCHLLTVINIVAVYFMWMQINIARCTRCKLISTIFCINLSTKINSINKIPFPRCSYRLDGMICNVCWITAQSSKYQLK